MRRAALVVPAATATACAVSVTPPGAIVGGPEGGVTVGRDGGTSGPDPGSAGVPAECQALGSSFRAVGACASFEPVFGDFVWAAVADCWAEVATPGCADAARAYFACVARNGVTPACGGGSDSRSISAQYPSACDGAFAPLSSCLTGCGEVPPQFGCGASCRCGLRTSHPGAPCCDPASDRACTDPASFCQVACSRCAP